MNLNLGATNASKAQNALITLIQEGEEDEALKFLSLVSTPEEARATIDEIKGLIAEAETKAALKDAADTLCVDIQTAASSVEIPENVTKLETKVTFDTTINTETGKPFGWIASPPKVWLQGVEKPINFGTKSAGGTGTRQGGGGKARVPVPQSLKDQGHNSWVSYLKATYPDHPIEGRSAARELGRLGDEIYLAAAAGAGVEVPNGKKAKQPELSTE